MMSSIRCALAAAVLFFVSGVAQAASINLTLQLPDIVSGLIDVNYYSGTKQFVASGSSLELDEDGLLPNTNFDEIGIFSIDATIDNSGNLLGGTISITGKVGSYTSGTLITGNLTDFGWNTTAGSPFEFEFSVTGGDMAAAYGGIGGLGGAIMNAGLSSFPGFGSDFSNNSGLPGFGLGSGISDTAPVPEPSTALLLGVGVVFLASRRVKVVSS